LFEKALHDNNTKKLAFLMQVEDLHAYGNKYQKSLDVLKKVHLEYINVIRTTSTNILVNQLDRISTRFIEAGIMTQLYSYGVWVNERPIDKAVLDPRRILSMTDLEFGFSLWLAAGFVAFLVFVCEKIHFKMQRNAQDLAGLFGLLRASMSDYHDKW
jgi:hypothetical protein